jgi:hypothetical protein
MVKKIPLGLLPRVAPGTTSRAARNPSILALLSATIGGPGHGSGGPSRQMVVWDRWSSGMAARAVGLVT